MALWVVIALLVFAMFNLFQGTAQRQQSMMAFSDFLAAVEAGDIRDVTIQGPSINGHYRDGRTFSTYAPDDCSSISSIT